MSDPTTPEIALLMLSNFGRADGGRETWAWQFIPHLLARYPGYRLRVIGFRVEGEPDNAIALMEAIPETDRARVDVHFLTARVSRLPNAFLFAQAMRRHFARPLPGVKLVLAVGSWVELAGVLTAPAFRDAGKLVWLRSIFAAEKAHRYPSWVRPLIERAERRVLARADRIVANGEDTAVPYRAKGLDVSVIPNATDLERWAMPAPRFDDPIDVAFVGRLTAVKGITEFLAAVRMVALSPSARRFRFHVVGDGPDRPAVAAAAAEGLLVDHGPLPNAAMPAFLASMDVCVALTFGSGGKRGVAGGAGTSNAAIEQMAAARLLICWDNAPFRQLLDPASALMVAEGDVAALARALEQVVADPQMAQTLALAGHRRSTDFGLARHLDRFAEIAAPWLDQSAGATTPSTNR